MSGASPAPHTHHWHRKPHQTLCGWSVSSVWQQGHWNRRLETGKLVSPGFGFHFTPSLVLAWELWVLAVMIPVGRCSKVSLSDALNSHGHGFLAVICNHPMTSVYSGYRPGLVLGVRNARGPTKSGKQQSWIWEKTTAPPLQLMSKGGIWGLLPIRETRERQVFLASLSYLPYMISDTTLKKKKSLFCFQRQRSYLFIVKI